MPAADEVSSSAGNVNERRGRRLAPIQTNFSRPTASFGIFSRSRRTAATADVPASTTTDAATSDQDPSPHQTTSSEAPQPSSNPSPTTKRQSSRTGLRNLFGLDRSLRRQKSDSKLANIKERPSSSSLRKPSLPSRSAAAAATAAASGGSSSGGGGGGAASAPTSATDPIQVPPSQRDIPPPPEVPEVPEIPTSPPTNPVSPSNYSSSSSFSTRVRNAQSRSVSGGSSKPVAPSAVPCPTMADRTYWKPPPLFQAYPQAIKYGCLPLPAPASMAESILILRRDKATGATRDNPGADNVDADPISPSTPAPPTEQEQQNADSGDTATIASMGSTRRRREARETSHHHRSSSGNNNSSGSSNSLPKMEWAQKIFVLATSGYLLQYAGEGRYDRPPEKMMRLGPKSVAFASDAIPGKHWVLQVTQYFDEDNATTRATSPTAAAVAAASDSGSKPLFSRLGIYRPFGPRMAGNLLLVFDSPRDMHSWLVAVRAEIEACGGRKYTLERNRVQQGYNDYSHIDGSNGRQPQTGPAPRRMVRAGPTQLSDLRRPSQQNVQTEDDDEATTANSDQSASNRQSLASYPSSPDAEALMSSGESVYGLRKRVPKSSWDSSMSSPGNSDLATNGFPNPASQVTRAAPKTQDQAQSMPERQKTPVPPSQAGDVSRATTHVPSGPPSREPTERSTSPPAPNFSVPSFSKKFSIQPGMPMSLSNDNTNSQSQLPDRPSSRNSSVSKGATTKRRTFFPPVSTRSSSMRFMEKKNSSHSSNTSASTMDTSHSPHRSPSPPSSRISYLIRKGSGDKLFSSVSHESSLRRMALSMSQDSLTETVEPSGNSNINTNPNSNADSDANANADINGEESHANDRHDRKDSMNGNDQTSGTTKPEPIKPELKQQARLSLFPNTAYTARADSPRKRRTSVGASSTSSGTSKGNRSRSNRVPSSPLPNHINGTTPNLPPPSSSPSRSLSPLPPQAHTQSQSWNANALPTMGRRKSLPTLSVGPPSAPPPNCPLPKIPNMPSSAGFDDLPKTNGSSVGQSFRDRHLSSSNKPPSGTTARRSPAGAVLFNGPRPIKNVN